MDEVTTGEVYLIPVAMVAIRLSRLLMIMPVTEISPPTDSSLGVYRLGWVMEGVNTGTIYVDVAGRDEVDAAHAQFLYAWRNYCGY